MKPKEQSANAQDPAHDERPSGDGFLQEEGFTTGRDPGDENDYEVRRIGSPGHSSLKDFGDSVYGDIVKRINLERMGTPVVPLLVLVSANENGNPSVTVNTEFSTQQVRALVSILAAGLEVVENGENHAVVEVRT
ncbi:MAG: hypothetical protein LCH53_13175 [Bacteroidetes bacterium]|nr:hypothetical protein [Bacteroidota bacterium]